MHIQKPEPTELNDVEDMRWAFVGVAFMVGLSSVEKALWASRPFADIQKAVRLSRQGTD